jgi:hypothetical protein
MGVYFLVQPKSLKLSGIFLKKVVGLGSHLLKYASYEGEGGTTEIFGAFFC